MANRDKLYMGIDVGSVSLNIAIIDEQVRLRASVYERTKGQPVPVLLDTLSKLASDFPLVSCVMTLIPALLNQGIALPRLSLTNLEPTTKSAIPSVIGLITLGISAGSCWPSASKVTRISASISLARLNRDWMAAP